MTHEALIALRGGKPARLPFWGDGSFVSADWPGRKPPRSGADRWGVTWAPLPDSYVAGRNEPAESYAVDHPYAQVEDLANLVAPDFPAGVLFTAGTQTLIGEHPAGPLDRLMSLLGVEQGYLALGRRPDLCADALQRIADHHILVARGLLAAGVHAGFLPDDYAGQSGPFISPRLWRRIVLPAVARILAVYREAGAPVIFHTCGRAEAFIGDLIEAGATAFNLQTELVDLAALKQRFGARIAFYGGVPTHVMLHGSPGEVAEAARWAAETLGRAGGLVLAPDQPLAYNAENTAAFCSEAAKSVL